MKRAHNTLKKPVLILFFLLAMNAVKGQSLSHPRVWVSNSDRQEILDNIDKYQWAKSMFNQLKNRQDDLKNSHKTNPDTYLKSLPSSLPISNRTLVLNSLNNAGECAILYYLTGDEGYAQVAGDILYHYTKRLKSLNALDILFFTTGSGNDSFNGTRESQPRYALIYDFIQPFLAKSNSTVFDINGNKRVKFNFNDIQVVFEKLADHVLKLGGMNSNHTLFEMSGGLFPIICMPDAQKRSDYFDRIINGDTRHRSVQWMADQFSKEEGIWMESLSYGKASHIFFLMNLNVIDRYAPELNLVDQYKRILDGVFQLENFNYPNGQMMCFGDSKRPDADNTTALRMVLAIADRKGYPTYKKNASDALGTLYHRQGGYAPEIVTERFIWTNPLQLLWGVHVPETTENNIQLYTTARANHAGIVMQRNFDGVANQEKDGLMYYTGGGNYVHAHPTGIDMELYGRGHIIAPEFGWVNAQNEHAETYARNHAAHNTVIVNGSAKRGPLTDGSGSWQNITDDVLLQGVEPKREEIALSQNFRFSTQYIDDEWNDCKQQRTNAIVRTSPTSGYYVDIFRSRSNGTNNYHDYLFHGLGDVMTLQSEGNNLALNNTPNRYKNDIGDARKQPGWHWFNNTKTSQKISKPVTARFDLKATGDYLHVSVPGSVEREYCSALAPPTSQALHGYDKKDTQMFIMRKYGEAWNQPFVALYEPSGLASSTIQSSEILTQNGKIVGVKVISLVNGVEITDYVLSADKDGTQINLDQFNITFKGRFGIVRSVLEPGKEKVDLYLGSGTSISYKEETLIGDNQSKGFRTFEILTRQGPEGYIFLVDENGTVSSTVPVDIAYGANGSFEYLYDQRDDVSCTNNTFGDPLPGAFKSCYIRESKTYYGNQPINIPGTLEAEFYDYGGKNVSFWDKTDDNKGAPEANFRTGNGVDIGLANGGMVIGWIGNGEWVDYTVTIEKTQYYDLTFHTSSEKGGGVMRIDLDGTTLLSDVEIPTTGSLDQFTTFKTPLQLPEGNHILRMYFEQGGFEIDKIEFTENTVLSVTEENVSEFKIYPNPSKDGRFMLSHKVLYRVYDIIGNILLESEGSTLNLSMYPDGIYILKTDNKIVKLIK